LGEVGKVINVKPDLTRTGLKLRNVALKSDPSQPKKRGGKLKETA